MEPQRERHGSVGQPDQRVVLMQRSGFCISFECRKAKQGLIHGRRLGFKRLTAAIRRHSDRGSRSWADSCRGRGGGIRPARRAVGRVSVRRLRRGSKLGRGQGQQLRKQRVATCGPRQTGKFAASSIQVPERWDERPRAAQPRQLEMLTCGRSKHNERQGHCFDLHRCQTS